MVTLEKIFTYRQLNKKKKQKRYIDQKKYHIPVAQSLSMYVNTYTQFVCIHYIGMFDAMRHL